VQVSRELVQLDYLNAWLSEQRGNVYKETCEKQAEWENIEGASDLFYMRQQWFHHFNQFRQIIL